MNKRRFIPLSLILVGGILVIGLLLQFIASETDSPPSNETRVMKRIQTDAYDSTEKSRSSDRKNSASNNGKKERPHHQPERKHMTSEPLDSGRHRFRIRHRVPFSLSSPRSVKIHLFFRGERIDERVWRETLTPEEPVISFHDQIGTSEERLPPGLYRATVTFDAPLAPRPSSLVKALHQFDPDDFPFYALINEHVDTLEFATPVGAPQHRTDFTRTYHETYLKRGRALLEEWDRWYKHVKRAYRISLKKLRGNKLLSRQEKQKRMRGVYRKLVNSLRDLEYASEYTEQFVDKHQTRYLVLPRNEERERLANFRRLIFTKVKHLMPTVLVQTLGGIPPEYPDRYPRHGFSPKLDVKHHMHDFHREQVQSFRDHIRSVADRTGPYWTVNRYVANRLKRLMDVPRAMDEISSTPFRKSLRLTLPLRKRDRQLVVRRVYEFMKMKWNVRAAAVRHALPYLEDERHPPIRRRISASKKALALYGKQLAKRLDVPLPGNVSSDVQRLNDPDRVVARFKNLLSSYPKNETESRQNPIEDSGG